MKKENLIFILILVLTLFFSSLASGELVYGQEDSKTILIILDELNFQIMEDVLGEKGYGIGFTNINTRKPYGSESLYFSLSTGRKVGVDGKYYKGLYQDEEGIIHILNFKELYKNLKKKNNNIELNLLGDQLKEEGISFLGEDSSAIIAANSKGEIRSGELDLKYNIDWLVDKTKENLFQTNTLILSYEIGETKSRINLLEEYIDIFKDYNIILIPNQVSPSMKHFINNSLVPVAYLNRGDKGLIKTTSTKREGLLTLGDLHKELVRWGKNEVTKTGIEIVEKENNHQLAKDIYKKIINLIFLATIFHGLVYFLQFYTSYLLNKDRLEEIYNINFYNYFICINIFLGLLMGVSTLHINLILYLLIILLVTYIISVFVGEREVNPIGLFSLLTYGIILVGIFFYPELIYNSFIGFNNLLYGARYYGVNNGIMGVLLVTSIISYYYTGDKVEENLLRNILCILIFSLNMIALSANYGTNTGGFITSAILFLVMIYINILEKDWNIKNIAILILMALLIFSINMYFDYNSENKSHAINFLIRIKNFGYVEFIDMFKIKFKELVKWTILPPFSIVIAAQVLSLKKLKSIIDFKTKYNIIILTAVIGFLINDTGMITFIYIIYYLIALIIYENLDKLSQKNKSGL